jgi:uncharacterized protein YcfJ
MIHGESQMIKFSSIKSGMVLTVMMIGLAGCSQPHRDTVSREPSYNREPQENQRRNSQRSSRRQEEVCNSCGVVSSVYRVEQEGRGTGVGAVVGGIVGNQVGGGTGKKVATVAGVIGGAVVGNKIEENGNDDTYYEITVDMERGGSKTFNVGYSAARGIGVGSRVTVSGNNIELR